MSYLDQPLDDGSDVDTDTGDEEGRDLRNLRQKAKKADSLEKENAKLAADARELRFIKAGVDTSTDLGQLFVRGYEGDDNDPEAIKAAYAMLPGIGSTESTTDGDGEISPEERESTRERQSLTSNAFGDTGETPPEPVRGPDGRAVKAGVAARTAGAGREDAMGVTFGQLVQAAAEGDQSVIVPRGGSQ
jgi:hypothetical protein